DAGRLVVIEATRNFTGSPRPSRVLWQLDAASRWEETLRAFAGVTFYSPQVFQLSGRNGAELVDGASVAPSFFQLMDGPIVAGRAISAADGASPSILISERLADRLFARSDAAVGGHLNLNGIEYRVAGVAGRQWDMPSRKTDVWESSAFARVRN